MSAGSARCRTCKEASRRSAGIARKCSAQPATCLSSCLIHRRPAPFISGHPGRIRAGRARWRTVVNAGAHCWKACWVQALASSNLASSATFDQAIHKPRSCVRPGLARLHSLICSLIYSTHIGIKRPKVQAHASECYRGCGRPLGVPALSDQLAAVAVTMGEHLGSDDAGCSTQIADFARACRRARHLAAEHRSAKSGQAELGCSSTRPLALASILWLVPTATRCRARFTIQFR